MFGATDTQSGDPEVTPPHTHYPLSSEKEDELRALYKALDAGGRGEISVKDLREALQRQSSMSGKTAQRRADRIMTSADEDHSGTIDFHEFVHYVLEHEKKLALVFNDIDRNRDGKIDPREVKSYFKTLGVNLPDEEANAMVKKMDTNNNLTVDLNEFVRSLRFQTSADPLELSHFWRHSLVIDIGEDGVIPEDFTTEQIQKGVWIYHLIAGGSAGTVSRTATAPFDRLKVFLQVYGREKQLGVASGFRYLLQEGGVKSLWRGNGVNVLKIAPESAIKFSSYEAVKRRLRQLRGLPKEGELSPAERFIAGASAGIMSQTAIYPMEVLKTRLALRKTGQMNRGIFVAAKGIYKYDGGVRAFFRGYVPNTIGVIPYAGIDLAVYETLKRTYLKQHSSDPKAEPGTVTVLLCGATSSTCGQLTSYPLALVRTRLQANVGRKHDQPNTMLGQFRHIVANDGFTGLYRGLAPNLMKVLPAVSISYVVYENVRTKLGARMS